MHRGRRPSVRRTDRAQLVNRGHVDIEHRRLFVPHVRVVESCQRATPGASRSESGRDVANDDAIYSESRHDVARAVAINSESHPGGVGGGRAPNLIATLHMCSFETVSLFLKFALRSKLPPSSTNDCRRRRYGAESCRDGRAGGARGSDGPTQSRNRGERSERAGVSGNRLQLAGTGGSGRAADDELARRKT